ncbi:MAG: hypothetical protein LASZOEIN_002778, partial [Candidatus Fervidibacter sp.]
MADGEKFREASALASPKNFGLTNALYTSHLALKFGSPGGSPSQTCDAGLVLSDEQRDLALGGVGEEGGDAPDFYAVPQLIFGDAQ